MKTLRLAAVGDVMLGDHPVCFGHGIGSAIKNKGCGYLVSEIAPLMCEHDLVLGNLECVLSDTGALQRDLPSSEMRGHPSSVDLLSMCGFNLMSVANNHMLQHGVEAFSDTTRCLLEKNIQPVGLAETGGSNLVKIERDGETVLVVGYSLRPENYATTNASYAAGPEQLILRQIRLIRAAHPRAFIAVSLHWGEEYLHMPSASQISFARTLVDCGAGLIIGHHPHVLQGIERYKDAVIAYSLGNFLFDSWQSPTRESAMLSCEISGGRVVDQKLVPFFISGDYSIRVAKGRELAWLTSKMERYAAEILAVASGNPAGSDEAYSKIAARKYLQYRLECYWYFVTHIWRYDREILAASLRRAISRRMNQTSVQS